jgi:biopolymer transport protein ExbB
MLDSFRAGGPVMIPLAAICLAFSFWVAVLYPRLLRIRLAAPRVLDLLENGDGIARVRAWAGEHRGPLARMLGHALAGGHAPCEIEGRLLEARRVELPRYERELTVLRALVAAAPLLGLLGTVKGMVDTFFVLSTHGVGSLEQLSGGISEALVTTQVGLIVAVPGLIGAHAIARRLEQLRTILDRLAARLTLAASGNGRRSP